MKLADITLIFKRNDPTKTKASEGSSFSVWKSLKDWCKTKSLVMLTKFYYCIFVALEKDTIHKYEKMELLLASKGSNWAALMDLFTLIKLFWNVI